MLTLYGTSPTPQNNNKTIRDQFACRQLLLIITSGLRCFSSVDRVDSCASQGTSKVPDLSLVGARTTFGSLSAPLPGFHEISPCRVRAGSGGQARAGRESSW